MSSQAPKRRVPFGNDGPPLQAKQSVIAGRHRFIGPVAALALPQHNLSRARHLITGNHSSASGAALAA
jgi:hypothetical protein